LTAGREQASWGAASRVPRQRFLGPAVDSTKAELLHRLGRDAEAADAYRAALALTSNAAEEQFLMERVHATAPSRFNGSSGSEPPPSGVS
jgi:hypothetical protein